jgi:hypothetical protein
VTAGARVVPSRRPRPARIAGFAALLVAVSWSLGTFSAWPWTATAPGEAVLRVSLRHVTGFSGAVQLSTPEEIAKLPPHMRPKDATLPATGRRADATLTVAIDGTRALERLYRPTGLRHDGPIYAYEEVAMTLGRHAVTVRLADSGPGAREWSLTREIEFKTGSAPLLEYSMGPGWQAEPAR